MNMVLEWDRQYNFRENIWILQVLLDICKANHLVSECAEFAKSTDVCYISRDCKGKHVFSEFYFSAQLNDFNIDFNTVTIYMPQQNFKKTTINNVTI